MGRSESSEQLMAQVREATDEMQQLLMAGEADAAAVVQKRIGELLTRARRAARPQTSAPPESSMSIREVVTQAMLELDAIVDGRLLVDYASARFSTDVDPSALASLRRDERKAWNRAEKSGRPLNRALVIPALDAGWFTPVRGKSALSNWPLWRRLVGPRTGRVELLRATVNVAEQVRWLQTLPDPTAGRQMWRVASRLASSLPGLDPAAGTGETLDHVVALASRELDELSDDDTAHRKAAAERAAEQLSETAQLWGAEKMAAVEEGRR